MDGNILMILQSLSPSYGGIESVGTQISGELRKRGYKVYCAFLYEDRNDKKNAETFENIVKIDVWQQGHDKVKLLKFIVDNDISIIVNQFHEIRLSWPLQNYIKKRSCVKWINTVHIDPESYTRVNEFNNGNLSRGLGGKISYFIYKHYIWYLRKKAYRHSDATILLAKSFIASYLKYLRTKNSNRLYFINNPVREFNQIPEKEKKENLIISVGRLQILQKRTDKILNFWSIFKSGEASGEWNLEIVGDGADLGVLQETAKTLNLTDCVFSGHTCNPESYYNRAKIILMTSDYEGWGLVLVEAMSYGCVPVVMNNFSSLREIVDDGINGIIVANDDYNAMTEGIKRISADFDRYSQEAIKKSQKYKAKNIIEQWEALLEKV